jgi:hypothetical protein
MRVLELEPMFALEAKKKQEEAGKKYGRGQKVVADLRQPIGVKASDQAAEVVSASTGTNGTTLFPSEYRH